MWEGIECFHKQGNRFSLSKPIQFWEERRKKQISLLSDELTECWVCVRLVPWCWGGQVCGVVNPSQRVGGDTKTPSWKDIHEDRGPDKHMVEVPGRAL